MARFDSVSNKVLTLEALIELRTGLHDDGLKLVQCHGCFDIVHPGHIRHLQFAAAQGDRLIVSITADAFVNKGPDRPMFSHDLRAENLAALEFVDWVYVHHESTAVELLSKIKPDIYIKGAEYAQKQDPRFADEREVVEANNGRVVFSSGDVVYSSSAIVDSILGTSRTSPGIAGFAQVAQDFDLSTGRIAKTLNAASGKRVVVVGETILDSYTHCHWPEIADEHPMLSLRPVSTEHFDGGAAIIAQHLAGLGVKPILCTPIPVGFDATELVGRLEQRGIKVIAIEFDGLMPAKQRFIVGRDKVMKLDRTGQMNLDAAQRASLVGQVLEIERIDAVVLADFGLGMFEHGVGSELIAGMRDRVELIVGDVSGTRSSLCSMHDVDVLCPSEAELRHAMNDQDSPILELAERLIEKAGTRSVVVTLGHDGLMVVGSDGVVTRLPALSQDPIDVLGCGDALLASLSVSMLGGGGIVESAYTGSIAAAVAGSVMGNLPVGTIELIAKSQSLSAQYLHLLTSSPQVPLGEDTHGTLI
jgi:rfaE bifunctional protein kinase chain/domain/rfaE bifunctional protein nucleotidyltransferase chain/domain